MRTTATRPAATNPLNRKEHAMKLQELQTLVPGELIKVDDEETMVVDSVTYNRKGKFCRLYLLAEDGTLEEQVVHAFRPSVTITRA
jgi:hypothetical protein